MLQLVRGSHSQDNSECLWDHGCSWPMGLQKLRMNQKAI